MNIKGITIPLKKVVATFEKEDEIRPKIMMLAMNITIFLSLLNCMFKIKNLFSR